MTHKSHTRRCLYRLTFKVTPIKLYFVGGGGGEGGGIVFCLFISTFFVLLCCVLVFVFFFYLFLFSSCFIFGGQPFRKFIWFEIAGLVQYAYHELNVY